MQDWIIDCCDLGAHLLQSPGWAWLKSTILYEVLWGKLWKKGGIASHGSQFWLLIRAFQILLSSSPATNRSMSVLVVRSCVLKSQDHDFWRFPSFSKARAQAFSLFLADPPTRGIANGWAVYTCLGLTAVGPTLPWGLPFEIKWDILIYYIND